MVGIVCEGGGMRGVFTAGVLQSFMDNSFNANLLVGVSAGASNGISYVSCQSERAMRTNLNYAGDKRYLSFRNYLRTGSFFGMDFLFGEIPEKIDPFDYDTFYSSDCAFWAGATNIETGKPEFFGKRSILPGLNVLRASCSLPIFSPPIEIDHHFYLDGGVSEPIPINKALEEGCDKLIVILTQPRDFRKSAQKFSSIYRAKYRKYPNLVRAIDLRHVVYNQALSQIEILEKENRALVIAPPSSLGVPRFGKDYEQLAAAYKTGLHEGEKAINIL